jgi:hypothetical protein
MPNYLFVYHGGSMPQSPEEQAKVMQAWGAWMGAIGPNLIDGGNPVGQTRTVAADGSVSDGGGANPASGYSVIKADSMDAAVQKAKGCPILQSGGSIEVCETFDAM